MAVCDICGAPGRGTTIGAKDMKAAVTKKGFNPLKKGLIKDPAAVAGGDMWYGGWKNMVIQDSSATASICGWIRRRRGPHEPIWERGFLRR